MTNHPTSSHRARFRSLAAAGLATSALILAGCTAATAPGPSTSTATSSAADAILAPYSMTGWDARQVITALEATPTDERPTELRASIRPDVLLLSDGQGREAELPMPKDSFYVSFAPYVDTTHECGFHSLTTCTGELGEEPLTITVTDPATGEVVLDEETTTAPNGFVGVWLPRSDALSVTISAEGGTATAEISTAGPDDLTCITTMQLS